ncbi:hypothetical protein SEPCBS119000_006710 [Sporothrix epigloea]|uniref:Antigenic cell wall galactomannoprotein n=1 Tax=Sporothrix epigloea TaxID=1892477 RepID=A0ABP0E7Q2_9PEZI
MLITSLLRVAGGLACATLVAGDGATIFDALSNVHSETKELQSKVENWNGDLLGAVPIATQSEYVLSSINDATDTAKDSQPLTAKEALDIASAVTTLATSVNGTMTAIINAYDDFKHLYIASIVLSNLETQKSASSEMSNAIIEKVPTPLQAIARKLAAPVDASFDQAIDVFSSSN